MNKMIFIDDDAILRRAICQAVDWAANGIDLIGMAKDSIEGLELIAQHRPQVVVTDIKMPRISGIELCQIINREYPDCKVILLSGHEQFHYAQQAIKYKVFAYLTKPVNNRQLLQTVLEATYEGQQEAALRSLIAEGEPLLLSKAFRGVLSGEMKPAQVQNLLERLQVPRWQRCIATVVQVSVAEDEVTDLSISLSTVVEHLREKFEWTGNSVLVDMEDNHFVLALLDEEHRDEFLKQQAQNTARAMCAHLQETYGFHACAVLGDPHGIGKEELRLSYLEAINPTVWNQLKSPDGVFFASDFDCVAPACRLPDLEVWNASFRALENALFEPLGDWQAAFNECTRIYREQSVPIRTLQLRLIRFLDEIHQRTTFTCMPDKLECDKIYIFGQTQPSLIWARVERHCKDLRTQMNCLRQTRSQQLIVQTTRYLEEHFADPDLSLGVLAEHAGVSLTYLSGLFSSELGENFQH